MAHRAVPDDTEPDIAARQLEHWRSLSPGERAAIADRMSIDVGEIALAGIRFDMPDADADQVRHELARRRYGRRLADAAYRRSGDPAP